MYFIGDNFKNIWSGYEDDFLSDRVKLFSDLDLAKKSLEKLEEEYPAPKDKSWVYTIYKLEEL